MNKNEIAQSIKKKNLLFIDFTKYSGSINGLLAEIKYLNTLDLYNCTVVSQTGSIAEFEQKKLHYTYYSIPSRYIYPSYNPPPRYNLFQYLYNYLFVLIQLIRISLKNKIDIIHCNHYQYAHYATILGFILRKHIIVHLKDVLPLKLKILRILMKFNPNITYIAVSNYVKKLFVDNMRLNEKKIVVIYDGINNDIFSPIDKEQILKKFEEEEKKIIMLSRVDREREIETYIDTAAILLEKHPKLRFIHYGIVYKDLDLDYFSFLKKRINSLRLQKKLKFLSFQFNQKKVAEILRRSFLCVITARNYALPNIAIECLMVGTPVILPATTGNTEVVPSGSFGGLTKTNSPKEYANIVEEFLKNKDLYIGTSMNSIKYAKRKFGYQMIYKKLAKLYTYI